jgi:predicted membrane protein (TIGR00267 family)
MHSILYYLRFIRNEEIARRYGIMNSFDGALTVLGIIIALYISGNIEPVIVIVSCLGAAVAMGVSGIWGAYAVERAERLRAHKKLELHMMADLDETDIGKRMSMATLIVALVDGLAPLFVSIIIILPFIFSRIGLFSAESALTFSFGLIILILMLLGYFIGEISRENRIVSAVKMLSAGIIVGVITIFLEFLSVI